MSIAVPLGGVRAARHAGTPVVCVYSTWLQPRGSLVRLALMRAGVAHRWVDVDLHPEAARVLTDLGLGEPALRPVVSVDGEWLSRPTLDALTDALRRHGLR